jgi:hypothetical protein
MARTELQVIISLDELPSADGQPRIKPPDWSEADWISSFFFLWQPEADVLPTLWCRRCGTQVLHPLFVQHYFELHQGSRL